MKYKNLNRNMTVKEPVLSLFGLTIYGIHAFKKQSSEIVLAEFYFSCTSLHNSIVYHLDFLEFSSGSRYCKFRGTWSPHTR